MSNLKVVLIDVGWGDSIFLEYTDDQDNSIYGLIDSNDTANLKSSFIFLKRYFQKKNITLPDDKPLFDFILLSHAHTDHWQGLKNIMIEFGTKFFGYPKSSELGSCAELIRYANRSRNVVNHESLNSGKILNPFGAVTMKLLWPPYGVIDHDDENNNSIVLHLEHGVNSIILSGDAEEKVWNQIANMIPQTTKFFKVPHHGSVNGTFGPNNTTPWLNHCPQTAVLGMSAHITPHGHPDREVIDILDQNNFTYFRTDVHYHIIVESDGNNIQVRYTH